jgi:type I restriction enzyme M protein
MLFLKRASDQFDAVREQVVDEQLKRGRSLAEADAIAEMPDYYKSGQFFVPPIARWSHIAGRSRSAGPGSLIDKALAALEEENAPTLDGVLDHISFTRKVGNAPLSEPTIHALIDHFGRFRLRNTDFEFPDLLGHAYEYLIGEFADEGGKKGGQFYTPRPIIRMMVRLVDPQEGQSVYDPCCGSGGMLILAKEYVEEHGHDASTVAVYGQEDNGGAWAMAKMNMVLHGVTDSELVHGDTLAAPGHEHDGELRRFDRILTNPPFAQNYRRKGMLHQERMKYGWCPESGKKADLMFVQHILAVLEPYGVAASVMPYGVLFRGGEEKRIREQIIKDRRLEAVIGVAPNVFYGTGIPACILVLRGSAGVPKERRSGVLFINADREFTAGRAQNHLDPQHAEKIVAAFREYQDIPGFARVVSLSEIADNDYNLNIRRYVDNAPPPEPHDVRAHLQGGVPKTEVAARAEQFAAYGIDPTELFAEKNADYYDFPSEGYVAAATRIYELAGRRERELADAYETWWSKHEYRLVDLPETKQLMKTRAELLDSFVVALEPIGVLDRFQIAGAIAAWWVDSQYDLKSLVQLGFRGVLDRWVANIESAFEEPEGVDAKALARMRADQRRARQHRLVPVLIPTYVEELEIAEALVVDLDARIKAGAPKKPTDDDDEVEEPEEVLSGAEMRKLKDDLAQAKANVRELRATFVDQLKSAATNLRDVECREMVLRFLRQDLGVRLDRFVNAGRGALVAAYSNWGDKYAVTVADIAVQRSAAAARLEAHLAELGYA